MVEPLFTPELREKIKSVINSITVNPYEERLSQFSPQIKKNILDEYKEDLKELIDYLIKNNKLVLPSETSFLPGNFDKLTGRLQTYRGGELFAFDKTTGWSPIAKGKSTSCEDSGYKGSDLEPMWFMPKESEGLYHYMGIDKPEKKSNYGIIVHRSLRNFYSDSETERNNLPINLIINMSSYTPTPKDPTQLKSSIPEHDDWKGKRDSWIKTHERFLESKYLREGGCPFEDETDSTLLDTKLLEHFNKLILPMICYNYIDTEFYYDYFNKKGNTDLSTKGWTYDFIIKNAKKLHTSRVPMGYQCSPEKYGGDTSIYKILDAWNYKTGYRESRYLPDRIWVEEQFVVIAIINNIILKACVDLDSDNFTIPEILRTNLGVFGNNTFNIIGTYANDTPWSLDTHGYICEPFDAEICLSLICFKDQHRNKIFNPISRDDTEFYAYSRSIYQADIPPGYLKIDEEDAKYVFEKDYKFDHQNPTDMSTLLRHETLKNYAFFTSYLRLNATMKHKEIWNEENVEQTKTLLADNIDELDRMLEIFQGGGKNIRKKTGGRQQKGNTAVDHHVANLTQFPPENKGVFGLSPDNVEKFKTDVKLILEQKKRYYKPIPKAIEAKGNQALKSKMTPEESEMTEEEKAEIAEIKNTLQERSGGVPEPVEKINILANINKLIGLSSKSDLPDSICYTNTNLETKEMQNLDANFCNNDNPEPEPESEYIVTKIKNLRKIPTAEAAAEGGFRKKRSSKGRKNKRKSTKKCGSKLRRKKSKLRKK